MLRCIRDTLWPVLSVARSLTPSSRLLTCKLAPVHIGRRWSFLGISDPLGPRDHSSQPLRNAGADATLASERGSSSMVGHTTVASSADCSKLWPVEELGQLLQDLDRPLLDTSCRVHSKFGGYEFLKAICHRCTWVRDRVTEPLCGVSGIIRHGRNSWRHRSLSL